MLDTFENWLNQNRSMITSNGYDIELTKSPIDTSNCSARLDLQSDKYLARITIWESGDCQLEIIDIESESTIMDIGKFIDSTENMNRIFEVFLVKLQ